MNYATLASIFGFHKCQSNGIQLLPDGRLLLKVSERSTTYNDTVDRKYIEFSYEGHIEGKRGARNGVVRQFLNNSLDANPQIVLAIGRFPAGEKKGTLIWSYDDSICLRGVIDKGLGVSPEFILSPVFKLDLRQFNKTHTPPLMISDSRHTEGPGHEDCKRFIVYILSNPSQPGLLKIGKTVRLKSRLGVLNTSVPTKFRLEEFEEFETTELMDEAEKEVHNRLDSVRLHPRKEFFECDVQDALDALRSVKHDLTT